MGGRSERRPSQLGASCKATRIRDVNRVWKPSIEKDETELTRLARAVEWYTGPTSTSCSRGCGPNHCERLKWRAKRGSNPHRRHRHRHPRLCRNMAHESRIVIRNPTISGVRRPRPFLLKTPYHSYPLIGTYPHVSAVVNVPHHGEIVGSENHATVTPSEAGRTSSVMFGGKEGYSMTGPLLRQERALQGR